MVEIALDERKLKNNPYEIICCLGQKSFSEVFLAEGDRDPNKSTNSKQKVIKKIAIPREADPKTLDSFQEIIQNEAFVLKRCACENIIKYYHLYKTPNNYCLVFEYCENGNLSAYLKDEKNYTQLSESERENKACEILKQLLEGVAVLHKNNYMHRDIKPSNILICKDYKTFKLGDLGLFKRFLSDFSLAGAIEYCAPEIIQKRKNPQNKSLTYDNKIDIWSLGTVFYEILTGDKLFRGENEIFELDLEKPFAKLSNRSLEILKLMLEKNPKKRVSAEDLVGKMKYLEISNKEVSNVKISSFYDSNCNKRNEQIGAEHQLKEETSSFISRNKMKNISYDNNNNCETQDEVSLFMKPEIQEMKD